MQREDIVEQLATGQMSRRQFNRNLGCLLLHTMQRRAAEAIDEVLGKELLESRELVAIP